MNRTTTRKEYAEQVREKAIQVLMRLGYTRENSESAFDSITDYHKREYAGIDEYSPIIRHAHEMLYNCGMRDCILTADDLAALGVTL